MKDSFTHCPYCDQPLLGDGVSVVFHCPDSDVTDLDLKPDSYPEFCFSHSEFDWAN